jgi:hypothetical protein
MSRKELIMKTITKALVGTVAAGAMAMASATPAAAQYRDRDRGNGIDVGDVIAGALIIGGIAAVASAAGGRNRGYNDGYVYEGRGYNNGYNNGYYNNGYNNAGNPRQAVEQCVYAAEQNASRYSYRGSGAQVTDIRNIDQRRDGYRVSGRIAVNTNNRNWRSGWGNDWRGYNNQYSGYDAGRFTCDVRYGRVVDLDYSGIRGLR